MPGILQTLNAFRQEHRRYGELDSDVDDGRVWMTCECGASIAHPVRPGELDHARERR